MFSLFAANEDKHDLFSEEEKPVWKL